MDSVLLPRAHEVVWRVVMTDGAGSPRRALCPAHERADGRHPPRERRRLRCWGLRAMIELDH